MAFVHNNSMACARILGNNWTQFGKLLQDWVKLLHTGMSLLKLEFAAHPYMIKGMDWAGIVARQR